ncbi:hypothetical protein STEG23_004245, partial [Scotinomys teguina]
MSCVAQGLEHDLFRRAMSCHNVNSLDHNPQRDDQGRAYWNTKARFILVQYKP